MIDEGVSSSRRMNSTERVMRNGPRMYRFRLLDERGEPFDPAAFLSTTKAWHPGETFSIRGGQRFRILAVDEEGKSESWDAAWRVERAR